MDIETSFGRWLRARRRALDLTQSDLARQVGCSVVTIRKLEADERRPSRQIAERLADGLMVAADQRAAVVTLARSEPYIASAPTEAPQPTLHVSDRPPTNLPVPLTRLIGRKQDIAAVRNALLRSEARLLTLIGPPGIGKTRLSIAVAHDVQAAFADGVYFVALAPLGDPALVLAAVAQTLAVRETADQLLLATLKSVLHARRLLLLLDNFEHLLDAAPPVVALLEACPGLKALVTSRAALDVRGERLYAVPQLLLPDLTQRPAISLLARNPAVTLFVERAQAVMEDFRLTEQNAATVAGICGRLEGLPLAIELAAKRVKLLAPEALLARLEQRLSLLTDGGRDLPPRHRTLRAAIDWSFELLGASEQILFRRLGVFVGGCTLAAAKVVCDSGGDLPLNVLDGLATLVDASLLRREEGQDHEPRFTMLETIHEYAIERLEASGEAEILRQQHAAYLLTLAERIMIESLRSGQAALRVGMDAEYANLRAALRYAAACGASETGAHLALAWAWVWRKHVAEGRRWLETFLQHRSKLPIALQVKAFNQAGDLATIQGDYLEAQALLEQSLALARELEDKQGIARALDLLGFATTAQGDYQSARKFLEQSQALSEELGDKMTLAVTLLRLGSLLTLQGDYTQAMLRCQESLALAEELQDALLVAWVFHIMGDMAQLQGDAESARTLFAKSLPVFQRYGDMIGIISHLEGMAQVAGLEDKPERLVRLFGAVERLRANGGSAYPWERAAFERQLLAAHAQLGEDAYSVAWAAGQTMTIEHALAYASGEEA